MMHKKEIDLSDINSSHNPASHSQRSSYDPNDRELGDILDQVDDFVNNAEANRI